MTKMTWDSVGQKFYEAGVDRGVLFVSGYAGVPWSGLISVAENPSGGASTSYYLDGETYVIVSDSEEYAATITAFTYPTEFEACNGEGNANTGLYAMHQPRVPFDLSYRTLIGNDVDGVNHGYKIHLVYGALVAPSQRANGTLNDSSNASDFSWAIKANPPAVPGFKATAHFVIDTRTAYAASVSDIEDIIYGTSTTDPRMPTFSEINDIFESHAILRIVDNGDGTWTATAADGLGIITLPGTSWVQTVIDNFDDNSFDMSIWSGGGTGVNETSGTLQITGLASYPTARSKITHDITSGLLAAKVSQSGTADSSTQFQASVIDANGNGVSYLNVPASSFYDWQPASSSSTTISNDSALIGVNASWVDGDWFGIGVIGSVATAYKSTDGQTWTILGTCTIGGPFDPTTAEMQFTCGDYVADSTYVVILDDFSYWYSPDIFEISWDSAKFIDALSYTIKSL